MCVCVCVCVCVLEAKMYLQIIIWFCGCMVAIPSYIM